MTTPLEPDRDQIGTFVDAIFRHAGPRGFVSIRSFLEEEDKPFRINATSLAGGLPFLIDVAEDDARRAAQNPKPVVFCPPLAVFVDKDHAREQDLVAGLALSVECDQHPQEARTRLEELLGPATIVVRSGGRWGNGSGSEDKLHLHWRLAQPAQGEDLAKLKQARDLAARIVGGDPSNKPVCHPIRWPGSWHRKAEPRLCDIDTIYPNAEIDLDDALDVLIKAAPKVAEPSMPGAADTSVQEGWPKLVGDIISGASYHASLVSLAARLVGSGMHDGTTVKLLRGMMEASTAAHDATRWKSRFDSIPRIVTSAREKYAVENKPPAAQTLCAGIVNAKDLRMKKFDPIAFMVPGLIPSVGVTLICAKPKVGKSWLLLDIAIGATTGRDVLGGKRPIQGDVLYLALEDSQRRLQSRATKLLPTFTGEWPEGLQFAIEWRRVDQGGLDGIRSWVEQRRAAGRKVAAVMIDVLKMIRPAMKKGQPAYDADYDAITGLQRLANDLGIAIIVAHHTRKAEAEDLIDKVSGTFGIVGAADTIIVIEKKTSGAIFDVRGRDVEGDELAAQFNKETCRWSILGDATEVFRSETRSKILAALGDSDTPVTPKAVTQLTGLSPDNVKQTLRRMAQNGEISHTGGGKYATARPR